MRALSLGLALLCGACASSESERLVHGNGAFSDDGTAVLLAASRRLTSGENPWFHDPEAGGWEVVFFEATASLASSVELARVPEPIEGRGQGGGILSAPLWWLRETRRVVALEYGQAVIYDLAERRRRTLDWPEAEWARHFALPGLDLRATGVPVTVVPSPDGRVVAVHCVAAFLGSGGPFDLRFRHALGFFEIDGTFLRSAALEPWNGSELQLRLRPFGPEPFPSTPPPPAHQPFGLVPSHHVVTFLWAKDSSGVFFVVNAQEEDGTVVPDRAVFVPVASGALVDVDRVPSRAVVRPGGSVAPDGTFLLVETPEGRPDDARVILHPTTTWVPFDDVPDGPPEELGFTW